LRNASSVSAGGPVLVLQGPIGAGRAAVAAALCAEARRPLLAIDIGGIGPEQQWPELVALVEREAALKQAGVLWHGLESFDDEAHRRSLPRLLRAIDDAIAPTFVSSTGPLDLALVFPRRNALVMLLPPPDQAIRSALWRAHLGVDIGEETLGVAARFQLTPGQIARGAWSARALATARGGASEVLSVRDLLEACRLVSNHQLATLARKVSSAASWDDLVLPDDCTARLRELCNQFRYRDLVFEQWGLGQRLSSGRGVTALFAGPSGTGKTMAASVVANELGLDLYKIDLSGVISKYIGETEKNLARIFAEAETSNAILFFDEADALFGKRSEVRDSHDRYANVEVSYLLQRMEEYEGIAILATNFRKNMDDAFTRRLSVTIEFPVPGEAERLRIWEGIFPAAIPGAIDLDLAALATRFELSGGNIKNIAVASAFLAAAENGALDMTHVLQATLREYQKIGRLME
jgi:SpoVK/Ycf46/Vps4 family AAA+-type ATPase